MKKIGSFILLAFSLFALYSCEEASVEKPLNNVNVILRGGNPTADHVSKTALNGVAVDWQVGDIIGVVKSSSETNYPFTSTLSAPSSTSDFVNVEQSLDGTYCAYYPFQNNGVSSERVKIEVASQQYPTVSSFGGNSDVLISKPFTVTSTTEVVDLQFTRATAVVRIILSDSNSSLTGETLKSLTMSSSSNDLTGRAYLSTSNYAFTELYYNSSKSVTANYTSETGFAVNGSNPVYLNVVPSILEAGSTLSINALTTTKTISKSILLPNDIVFEAGKVTTLNVAIASSHVSDTPIGHSLPIIDNLTWSTSTTDDSSTDLTSSVSTIKDDYEVEYVKSCSAIYSGKGGTIKFGTGSKPGELKTIPLDLSDDFTIYISTKQYNATDGGTVDVYVDEELVRSITPGTDMAETIINCDAASTTSSITIKTSALRAYVGEIYIVPDGYVFPSQPATVSPDQLSVNLSASACSSTVGVTYTLAESYAINVYSDLACTQPCTWLTATFDSDHNVQWSATANSSTEGRTAYVKVSAFNSSSNETSKVISFIQAGFVGDAENGAVIWSETFEGFNASVKPTTNSTSTIVYGGGSVSYEAVDGGTETKTYSSGLVNKSKELLVAKNGGSFTVSNIPTGNATAFTLTFGTNNDQYVDVSLLGDGTVRKINTASSGVIESKWKIVIPANESSFGILVSNTNSSTNVRVDNFQIVVGAPKDSQTISFAESNKSITLGDDYQIDGTYTIQSASHTVGDGAVSYSVDNSDVAEVNASNGDITVKAAGTVVVTATASETTNYAETSAQYTLTINPENGGQGGDSDPITLTFDLSSDPGFWPTTNSTTLTNYTYSLNDIDYTFGLKNVKCNSGYLMLTQPAALGLPAIEGKKLTKVVAKNTGGCSTSVNVGISSSASSADYVSGGAAQKWATQSSSYTYTLSETALNTVYYLYVTSKNAQITELTLTYN